MYRILRNSLRFQRIHMNNLKYIKNISLYIPKARALPFAFSFSLFTWLGFDEKKISPEDELINTIKHCILFTQRNEYEKAEQLLHVALRQAQQLNHQDGITYIYDIMANLALERSHLEKAKQLFVAVSQRIMGSGATEDDPRVVHISLKLARISHLQKDFNTAQLGFDWVLDKLYKALKINPSNDNKKLLAMAEDWYARLFIDGKQYEHGLKLLVSALDHMKEVPDVEDYHIVTQLNDIGTVCDLMNRTDDSLNYFKQAIELGKTIESMENLGIMYVNLGQIYFKKNLLKEAKKYCGHGWKLGVLNKNDQIKDEAESCIKQINNSQ